MLNTEPVFFCIPAHWFVQKQEPEICFLVNLSSHFAARILLGMNIHIRVSGPHLV